MMRLYDQPHPYYGGIDLHARTMHVCVLDQAGQVAYDHNLPSRPDAFLQAIAPFRDGLVVGAECMFAWYWLADLCREQQIDYNPCANVPKPRVPREEMKVWSGEQVRKFLQATAGNRLAGLYVLALNTGAGQGELFALRWDDVDFKAGAMKIQRSLANCGGSSP